MLPETCVIANEGISDMSDKKFCRLFEKYMMKKEARCQNSELPGSMRDIHDDKATVVTRASAEDDIMRSSATTSQDTCMMSIVGLNDRKKRRGRIPRNVQRRKKMRINTDINVTCLALATTELSDVDNNVTDKTVRSCDLEYLSGHDSAIPCSNKNDQTSSPQCLNRSDICSELGRTRGIAELRYLSCQKEACDKVCVSVNSSPVDRFPGTCNNTPRTSSSLHACKDAVYNHKPVEGLRSDSCLTIRYPSDDKKQNIAPSFLNSVRAPCDHEKDVFDVKTCDGMTSALALKMSRYVALDCEFVGVKPINNSALGRCSIINYDGSVLYDSYVRPEQPITDYRTRWSGIRPRDMKHAVSEYSARHSIINLLKDKVIIGHALFNDFSVLKFSPPPEMVRDTSCYTPLHELAQIYNTDRPALKKLTMAILGETIQRREHCSVEDAKAALQLYKVMQTQWESDIDAQKLKINVSARKKTKKQNKNKASKRKHPNIDNPAQFNVGLVSGNNVGSFLNRKSTSASPFLDDQFWPDFT